MAKRSTIKSRPTGDETYLPWLFATISQNGKAPQSRITNCTNAYTICQQLKMRNLPRELKWSSIFKCYNLFPPNSYSQEAARELLASSNVPSGQMYYRVNKRKGSFYDLVTQRNRAANIITKLGNENEKEVWSDLISDAWDYALRNHPSYLYNNELTIQELNLYGKGFEFADDKNSWFTTSLLNSEVLIPNDTYADLRNLGYLCLKRTYTPLQFWDKIRNEKEATAAGWNFWAAVDAIRFYTNNNYYFKTPTEFLHSINAGGTVLTQWEETKINLFELYVKEYSGKITKSVLLQNYGPIMAGYNKNRKPSDQISEEEYRKNAGFLFVKQDYADDWAELLTPFTCSTGSGFWHEIKGYAEGIYTQCRAYDIHFNKVMNAILINNTFLLESGSADASQKVKRMEWYLGGMQVLPQDVRAVQNRFEMPIGETVEFMQFYTGEMDRGSGQYMQSAPAKKGGQRTLGEAQLDIAEDTKLEGTELRGYNISQTRWQRQLYKRFDQCKKGWDGYELRERFMSYLKDNGVPPEAYAWENIESLESNLIGGAGSPAYRAIIGEKLVQATAISPISQFQANAVQDWIAGMTDRAMVKRYFNTKPAQIPKEIWEIGMENSALTDENCNPENVRVLPEQNHLEHIKGHYSDAMAIATKWDQALQMQQAEVEDLKEAFSALNFHGAHITAHLQFLEKDPTKKNELKMIGQSMQQLQKLTDEIGSAYQQMAKAQQEEGGQQGMSPEDIKIHAMVAQEAIKTKALQDKENIKLASTATKHQLQQETKKEAAATQLAIKTADANQKAQLQTQQANLDSGIQAVQAQQDLAIERQKAEVKLQGQKKVNAKKTKGK